MSAWVSFSSFTGYSVGIPRKIDGWYVTFKAGDSQWPSAVRIDEAARAFGALETFLAGLRFVARFFVVGFFAVRFLGACFGAAFFAVRFGVAFRLGAAFLLVVFFVGDFFVTCFFAGDFFVVVRFFGVVFFLVAMIFLLVTKFVQRAWVRITPKSVFNNITIPNAQQIALGCRQ